ncbi:hypothetical protein SAMN05421856_10672 [Chryseobacterium taichungense]|uniref:Uncharacterized protein n=1 Tax=Chryseobacterium taichungense TaxID=295069 RepID=A0A1H8AUD2_9FLAO|nr:hypothetical protein [Chryseobacterium taichungense]SEM74106.1 hypothetical protein SAMN05421856_10672 [Chryseobacterium taichungense]
MSKFLPQKRKLLEEVFQKASNDTPEKSFNGIVNYLERTLKDDYQILLSYKSFETYYKTVVERDEDYNIKTVILDDLSRYLEYDNFRAYCLDWKTIEYTISQTLSKIVINITNKPIFTMPDFFKKNGLGIMEMVFVLLLVTGGVVFSNPKSSTRLGFISGSNPPATDKPFMYWNKDRYMATDSSYLGPQIKVEPMDEENFTYLKKITRPDTLTVDNALHKVWYDKSNNEVEFFTSFGKHPENGKTLKEVTPYIISTYAGE